MNRDKVKQICFGLLAVLIVFHLINNLFFLSRSPLPEGKDSYAHITAFSNFKQILENKQNNPFFRSERDLFYNLVFTVIDYPPVFYLSAYLVNMLLNSLIFNAALLTNTFYLIILLLSVYFIAGRTDHRSAIISVFICSMYPIIFIASRHFSLELALAAVTALSLLLLLKTNYLEHRKFTLMLGIFLGIGMLIKQSFMIYICGPLILYVWVSFTKGQKVAAASKKKVNLIACFITAALISLVFYYNKEVYQNILNRAGFAGAVSGDDLFSLDHLTYYLRTLPNTIGYFFIFVFIGALFFLNRIKTITKPLLILWIAVPLIFFTFIKLKYAEYTIAFLAPFSLISGFAIFEIKKKNLRDLIIVSIVAIGIFNYYAVSLGKTKNFYATYYLAEPALELAYSKNKSESAEQVLEGLAFRREKVGIFYDSDSNALVFPSYFIRLTGLDPRKKAQIVDFSFCPDVFFHALDDFDTMIFITCSDNPWITEQSFSRLINQMNNNGMNQFKYDNADIMRLVKAGNDFKQMNKIICNSSQGQENVYIYKRNK